MKISDELVNTILQKGGKKAAQGVLFPAEGDGFIHLLSFQSEKELEGLTEEEGQFYEFCSKKEIIRLRSIKGPHDYLLRLRANAISTAPRAIRVMASRRANYEETGRPWSLSHYYHTKDYHHKSYISLLGKKNSKKAKSVPSGLAYINEMNALCIKSLAGDVVLVSESLEHFYYFMTIAFYGNLYHIEWIDRVDALIIALRIANGTEALDFDIDPRGELPHEPERKIQALVQRQMQFTFGHEYAHYLCNHIPSAETSMKMNSSHSYLNELAKYNYSLEYEADYFALKNIEVKKNDFDEVTEGAFSVLIYLHFIEQYGPNFGIRNFSVSETHPAAKDRVNQLFDNLGKNAPINKSVVIDEMFLVADDLSKVLKLRADYLTEQLKGQCDDIFDFYGSLYLTSFKKNRGVDRVDF